MAGWHDEARAMHAKGMDVNAIAVAVGHNRQMARWALDLNGEREKQRLRVKARRHRERPWRGTKTERLPDRVRTVRGRTTDRDDAETVIVATSDKLDVAVTLPRISLPRLPEPERRRNYVPKIRMTSSSGAERWRSIHLAMIRAGKIALRGDLLSEIGR